MAERTRGVSATSARLRPPERRAIPAHAVLHSAHGFGRDAAPHKPPLATQNEKPRNCPSPRSVLRRIAPATMTSADFSLRPRTRGVALSGARQDRLRRARALVTRALRCFARSPRRSAASYPLSVRSFAPHLLHAVLAARRSAALLRSL